MLDAVITGLQMMLALVLAYQIGMLRATQRCAETDRDVASSLLKEASDHLARARDATRGSDK